MDMDLFGDLPPSKKARTNGDQEKASSKDNEELVDKTPSASSSGGVPLSSKEEEKQDGSAVAAPAAAAPPLPPAAAAAAPAGGGAAAAAPAAPAAPAADLGIGGGGRLWRVGLASACYGHRGRRRTMEDAHLELTDAQARAAYPGLGAALGPAHRVALYGVFDGHGGRRVADFVQEELPRMIFEFMVMGIKAKGLKKGLSSKAIPKILKHAFLQTDIKALARCAAEGWADGACAVVALIVDDRVHVANLGDSRAALCRRRRPGDDPGPRRVGDSDVGGGGTGGAHTRHRFPWERGERAAPPAAAALPLTVDHSPARAEEKARVLAAGGTVEGGRVNGALAVSRSFGDEAMKKCGVIAEPDLRVSFPLTPQEEFLILGCDGLWARYNEQMAVTFARTRLAAGASWCQGKETVWTLPKVCRALVDDAIFEKGGQDNTSCMIITFQHPDNEDS